MSKFSLMVTQLIVYSVDGITDDESGMKKIQLTFLAEEVLFKE